MNDVSRHTTTTFAASGTSPLWPWVSAIAAVIALETWVAPWHLPVVTAGAALLPLVAVPMARRLELAVLAALLACLVAPHIVDGAVTTTPFRIFAVDMLMIGLVAAALVRAATGLRRVPHLGHYLIILGAGLLWTLLGIYRGNTPNDALGVFRRLCLYAAAYPIALLAFDRRLPSPRNVRRLLVAGALVISFVSVVRILLDRGYAHDYFATDAEVPQRFMSYIEAIIVILAFHLTLGEAVLRKGRARLRPALVLLVLLVALVGSNYRAVWLAFLVSLVLWIVATGQKVRRYVMPAAVVGVGALVIVVALISLTDHANLPTTKFSLDNLRRTLNWRIGSWQRAATVFLAHPLVGTGFGYHHVFQYVTGEHFDLLRTSEGKTIHNDLLWLLVNWGLVGAAVLLSLHVRWWRSCKRALGEGVLASEERRMVAAVVATVAAVILISMLQPVFSVPPAVVALYILMAYALRMALVATNAPETAPIEEEPA